MTKSKATDSSVLSTRPRSKAAGEGPLYACEDQLVEMVKLTVILAWVSTGSAPSR
jgi:hypothetical protein